LAGQPEIRIMTDFFNSKVRGSVVCDVKFMHPKRVRVDLEPLRNRDWRVHSVSRGKEIKLIFQDGEERRDLLINFYKGGVWEWYENEEATKANPDYERDHRLSLHLADGSIMSHQDQFHQSNWRWAPDRWGGWEQYRSPDIVFEYNEYRRHIYKHRKHFHFKKPIYQIMFHQWFFNGFNNFSRCEILARTRFSPFTPMCDVLASEVLREDFFEISREVMEDIYRLGGMQFGRWKNPFGVDKTKLNRWCRVYHQWGAKFFIEDDKKFYFHRRWVNEWKYIQLKKRTQEVPEEELLDGEIAISDI